jgi:hypothetical protein
VLDLAAPRRFAYNAPETAGDLLNEHYFILNHPFDKAAYWFTPAA